MPLLRLNQVIIEVLMIRGTINQIVEARGGELKDYFYKEISKCFENIISTEYGAVTVGLLGNDEHTNLRYTLKIN